jgi:RimJ/RimL family protein N-acetyltransferase
MAPAPSLETARLALRPVADRDVPELAALLADPGRGQGLAEEACRACLDLALERGLAEVLAGADAPNRASLRLIERLGFAPLRETPGAFGAIRWFVRRVTGPPRA